MMFVMYSSYYNGCVLDERTDMWSLGCLLFAMAFGGRSPFDLPDTNTGGSVGMLCIYHLYFVMCY